MTLQGKQERILFINPFGIGDVLFTTPCIAEIRKHKPGAFIGYWCNERLAPLLGSNFDIDLVFALSRGDLKRHFGQSFFQGISKFFVLLVSLKKGRFDICLDFSLDHRYSMIAWLIGIKERIGFDYKGRGFFLNRKTKIDSYAGRHIVEHYLRLLAPLGVTHSGTGLGLRVNQDLKERAKRQLTSLGVNPQALLIGIAPGAGASWGRQASLKQWPVLKFARLCRLLTEELGAQVIILGDSLDKPLAGILKGVAKTNIFDLCGSTRLEELAAVLSMLNLLITNDGGPLHLAVSQGIKTVSIFGPVDEKSYGPYPQNNPRHLVITKAVECRPCYKDFRMPICQHNRVCLEGIEPESVFTAAKGLLENRV